MRTAGVVLGHSPVELALGQGEIGEDLAPEELGAKAAVEALDLARRGRRTGSCEPVGDAVLPADLVEERLQGIARAARPSVKISSGTPWRSKAAAKNAQTLREMALFMSPADTSKLHRPPAFPALVVNKALAPRLGLDEAVAHEGAIDPALGRSRRIALLREPVSDRALAPERVQPP